MADRAPAAGQASTDPATWEWVSGFDAAGRPRWGNLASRVPVFEDPDGVMRSSAVWVPGLERVLMVTNHTARNGGNLAFWEAPQAWGPWTLVLKSNDFPEHDDAPVESNATFANFAPKWFSADGRSGVLVFFRPDRWNSVALEIVPEEIGEHVPGPTLPALAALVLALLAGARAGLRRVART